MATTAVSLVLLSSALLLVGEANDYKDPHTVGGRQTIVHLFEWRWDDIADECVRFLGPYGYAGVQVSPPNENAILWEPSFNPLAKRPWFERYQPVSYKMTTRSGTEEQFASMVRRCNQAGVRIYVDIVINHMTGGLGKSKGTSGSEFDSDALRYPGVPFGPGDFNSCDQCGTSSCDIENYGDPNQVRNCRLLGLRDLNQGKQYVRETIVKYLDKLIGYGVAGFRVDAAKHMWPSDVEVILGMLKDLNPEYFPQEARSFIYQEVIDLGGEPVHNEQYIANGRVTEFKYGYKLGEVMRRRNQMKWLQNFGENWGFLKDGDSLVFIDNHDNQRGHGASGFNTILTHFDSRLYKMATAFMLAWPYGFTRVMSSYAWPRNIVDDKDTNDWIGPPHDENYNILPVAINPDLTCGNGWVCEHRWRQIYNMVRFRNTVVHTNVESWWDNGNHQIAFSRGDKGFIAINNEDSPLKALISTTLPAGKYCDVITGNLHDGECTGRVVEVKDGKVDVEVSNGADDPILAIHINAKLD